MNVNQRILFPNKPCFKRSGITNLHNEYAEENPLVTKVTYYQHEFKINMCGQES